jgi:hypothetical protein
MHLQYGIGRLTIRNLPGATTRRIVIAQRFAVLPPSLQACISKVQGFHLRGNVRFRKSDRVLDGPLFRARVEARLAFAARP